MFVTPDDFVFPYNLPDSSDAPTVLSDLIDYAEPEILRSLLGAATYQDFLDGVLVDPDAEEPEFKPNAEIDQKWLDLRDGAEYTYKEKVYQYTGLKLFLKPYLYQEWISRNAEDVTLFGVSQPDVENAKIVSPGRIISKEYNKFSRLVGNCEQYCDTFWGFMKANEETYPDWLFKNPSRKNSMGL